MLKKSLLIAMLLTPSFCMQIQAGNKKFISALAQENLSEEELSLFKELLLLQYKMFKLKSDAINDTTRDPEAVKTAKQQYTELNSKSGALFDASSSQTQEKLLTLGRIIFGKVCKQRANSIKQFIDALDKKNNSNGK